MSDDKFCIDCKWVTENVRTQRTGNGKKRKLEHYCKHPRVSPNQGKRCLVTGEVLPDELVLCHVERVVWSPCGVEGKCWEAKDE